VHAGGRRSRTGSCCCDALKIGAPPSRCCPIAGTRRQQSVKTRAAPPGRD
jgi:hypothetical protein